MLVLIIGRVSSAPPPPPSYHRAQCPPHHIIESSAPSPHTVRSPHPNVQCPPSYHRVQCPPPLPHICALHPSYSCCRKVCTIRLVHWHTWVLYDFQTTWSIINQYNFIWQDKAYDSGNLLSKQHASCIMVHVFPCPQDGDPVEVRSMMATRTLYIIMFTTVRPWIYRPMNHVHHSLPLAQWQCPTYRFSPLVKLLLAT
jgi:hypothetical protein